MLKLELCLVLYSLKKYISEGKSYGAESKQRNINIVYDLPMVDFIITSSQMTPPSPSEEDSLEMLSTN